MESHKRTVTVAQMLHLKPWTPGAIGMRNYYCFCHISITWCRANEATRQIGSRQFLLQNGDDLLIEVLHGHGGDVPQLLQNLMSSLRCSGRVHVAQHAVNLIYNLMIHNST